MLKGRGKIKSISSHKSQQQPTVSYSTWNLLMKISASSALLEQIPRQTNILEEISFVHVWERMHVVKKAVNWVKEFWPCNRFFFGTDKAKRCMQRAGYLESILKKTPPHYIYFF